MSQKGLQLTANVFSLIQETRVQLLEMGLRMTQNSIDKQDLMLAVMLEEMNDQRSIFKNINTMKKYLYINVFLKCNGEFVNENTVKFISIQKDSHNNDILTFKCPKCNKTHKSNRYGHIEKTVKL